MANTITQRTVYGTGSDKLIIRHIHIVSDGTEETDLVVYDNSAFVADVAKGRLLKVQAQGDSSTCRLEWDQSTDSPILSCNPDAGVDIDFSCFGGVTNPGGTGATGDIVLTTTDLDAGDEVSIYIYVAQN